MWYFRIYCQETAKFKFYWIHWILLQVNALLGLINFLSKHLVLGEKDSVENQETFFSAGSKVPYVSWLVDRDT